MAGVKGRSGRRSLRDEQKRFKVIDKAWDIAWKILSDEDTPLRIKKDLVQSICSKDMPEKHDGVNIKNFVIMANITNELGEEIRYNIGNPIPTQDIEYTPEARTDNTEV